MPKPTIDDHHQQVIYQQLFERPDPAPPPGAPPEAAPAQKGWATFGGLIKGVRLRKRSDR